MATFTVSTDTNYSSLSGIANNDSITIDSGAVLTVDTSTIDINQVQCTTFGTMQINNTSTTTPIIVNVGAAGSNRRLRFEAGGKLIARGDRIQIGTGDGTANQVISLPTSDTGANLPNLGGLWSEQGDTLRDSTSIPRLHLQVSDASNACTLEFAREIFTQDTTANTVTMVYPVPVGDPIYMSNIIIAKGATASGTPFFDMANSGVCDLQYVHVGDGWDVNLASASSSILDYFAVASASADLGLNNQINAPTVTNTIFVGPATNPTVNLSASANAGTFKNVWADSGRMDNNGFNASNTANGYFERITNTCYGAPSNVTSIARGAFYFSGPNHTVYDCTSATGSAVFYASAGSGNIKADNLKVMHGCRSTHDKTAAVSLIRLQNSANNTITRLHHQDPEVFGGFNGNSDALDIDAGAVNCTIDDVVIYAGSVAGVNSVINEAGANNRYNNITVYGLIRNKTLDFATASLGAEVSNLVFDQTQTATTNCELGAGTKVDQVGVGRNTNNIATGAIGTGVDCISTLFYDFNDDGAKTTGRWHTRMSPTVEETDYYTEITKTGAIVFNNNNQLYMTQAGDQIELESRVHYNITGSDGGYGTNGTNVSSGFTTEFALRRPNGTYTAYQTPNTTNFNSALASLDADAQNALQIKWRITRNASNATDNIQNLYFDVTLSGDDHPFNVNLPIPVSITNIVAGSRLQIYNVTTDTEIVNEIVAGTTYSSEYQDGVEYTAGDSVRVVLTNQSGTTAYTEFDQLAVATSSGWSVLANQSTNDFYSQFNTDGSTITEFSWDGVNLEIDIMDSDNKTIIQRIASWYYYFITTEVGVRDFYRCIKWEFYNQIQLDTDLCNVKLDNKKTDALLLEGGRLYRKDGQSIISDTTTGPIHVVGGVGSAQGTGSANITLDADAGLTLTAEIYSSAGAQVGSTVSMTDNGSGLYTGTFPLTGVADGEYSVRVLWGDEKYGIGTLYVRGESEVTQNEFFDPNFDIVQSVSSITTNIDKENYLIEGTKQKLDDLNDVSTAQVQTELQTYDAPTKAELDAGLGALNDISTADVKTQADQALTDYGVATSAQVSSLNNVSPGDIDAAVAPIKTQTDKLTFNGDNVNTNTVEINEIEVQGSGTPGDPWRPV